MLFCLADVTALPAAFFGGGYDLDTAFDEVLCSGNENRLTQCSYITDHKCTHLRGAGVRCSARTPCPPGREGVKGSIATAHKFYSSIVTGLMLAVITTSIATLVVIVAVTCTVLVVLLTTFYIKKR